MNILVTIDYNYMKPLSVMLHSLSMQHPAVPITVYVAHSTLTEDHISFLRKTVETPRLKLSFIFLSDDFLEEAPTTDRYPKEMYYRIFATQYLPESLDRVLYLDPDLVVINPLTDLYALDFKGNLFAAATHINSALRKLNEIRLDSPINCPYINSGVMLMNLNLLRKTQNIHQVIDYIDKYHNRLLLPDQDVISTLYGDKILLIDALRYNMTERTYSARLKKKNEKLSLEEIRKNSCIIHYCGRNKPWKSHYRGKLNVFYQEVVDNLQSPDISILAKNRLLLIVNPHAGKGAIRDHFLDLVDYFVKNEYDVTVKTTQRSGEIPSIIRDYAEYFDLIVSCGGDGTLNESVSGLLQYSPDSIFGYIPAGTVNDFASSLNLPKNAPLKAASVITSGEVFQCDIGSFNERYFTYIAAFGAFTDVSYSTPQEFKNLFGKAAYFMQGMSRLSTLKTHHVIFTTPQEVIEGDYLFGMISNTLSVAGIPIKKDFDVSLNDGLLEVLLVKNPKNLFVEWPAIVAAVLEQNINSPYLTVIRSSHLHISSPDTLSWTLDGEFGGNISEVDIGIEKDALHIIAPRE